MGELRNNVTNYSQCLHVSENNNNLINIKPKILPTPKLHYNYNNTNATTQTVTKKIPSREKGSETGTLKRESVETALSSALSNPCVLPEPVLANADSGATGTYLRLADINVLRDVKMSSPTDQITVAVAEGTLIKSTHYGFLDVPGHGAMIAHIFPQLSGSLSLNLSIWDCTHHTAPTLLHSATVTTKTCFKATAIYAQACGWWI